MRIILGMIFLLASQTSYAKHIEAPLVEIRIFEDQGTFKKNLLYNQNIPSSLAYPYKLQVESIGRKGNAKGYVVDFHVLTEMVGQGKFIEVSLWREISKNDENLPSYTSYNFLLIPKGSKQTLRFFETIDGIEFGLEVSLGYNGEVGKIDVPEQSDLN